MTSGTPPRTSGTRGCIGRVLCLQVGIPGGGVKMTVDIIPLVFGQKKVVGSIVGGRSDMQLMLELAAKKNIKPIIEVSL